MVRICLQLLDIRLADAMALKRIDVDDEALLPPCQSRIAVICHMMCGMANLAVIAAGH